MDGFTLRCNNLRCRCSIDSRAIVTTCCHVFCLPCGQTLHLTSPPPHTPRRCPACDTSLHLPDDCVVSILNPTDDYKTSVLSGLSPSVILEICGRGLAFWNYQVTQEVVYQEHIAKSLTEKYKGMSVQMDRIIAEANAEISRLREKAAAAEREGEELRRKNHELVEGWREKGRKLAQTQELYDKLKRRTLVSQVREAAAETVDQTLHMRSSSNLPNTTSTNPFLTAQQPRQANQSSRRHHNREPDFLMTGARIGNINGPRSNSSNGTGTPPPRVGRAFRSGGDTFGIDAMLAVPGASQEHRQRLPATPTVELQGRGGAYGAVGGLGVGRSSRQMAMGGSSVGAGGAYGTGLGKTRR